MQHQTNRSQPCSRSAQRMLYVVAVGTLISTLNQVYKSSEMHVSTRMISGGRLLALTSRIYIGAIQLRRSSALHRAAPSRAEPNRRKPYVCSREYAQYRRGSAAWLPCPSSVKLREYLHKIYYPTAVKEPFRKLHCANTQTCEKRSSLGMYPSRGSHRVNLLYPWHS